VCEWTCARTLGRIVGVHACESAYEACTYVVAREREGERRHQVLVLHHSKHVKDGVHAPDPQPA